MHEAWVVLNEHGGWVRTLIDDEAGAKAEAERIGGVVVRAPVAYDFRAPAGSAAD